MRNSSGKTIILPSSLRSLMVAQSLSQMGDTFTLVALAVFVLTDLHYSPAALGLVMAMMYAPRLSLGWLAMGWIDRWNKRRVMLISDGGRAALVLSIALVHNFVWTVVAIFLVYTLSMLYQPTVRAIQPQLAGSPEINRVSVTRQQQWTQGGNVLAYIGAGTLILHFGTGIGFLLDGLSYVTAGVLVALIPRHLSVWQGVSEAHTPYTEQIREGVRYTQSHRVVIVLIVVSFSAMMAISGVSTLLAPAVERVWHQPTAHYAWALLSISIGSVIGSWLLEHHGQHISLRNLLIAGFIITGLSTAALAGTAPLFPLIVFLLLIGGFGNAMFASTIMVWLQQILPVHVRGRVMTLRTVLMGLGGVIGSYGAGLVATDTVRLGLLMVAVLLVISAAMIGIPQMAAASSDAAASV